MSQAQNPRDNQALLQSMLQRLKLQAGTTNLQSGQSVTEGHNTPQETSDLQTITNNNIDPVNGFEPTGNVKRDLTVNGKTQGIDSFTEGSTASGQSKEQSKDLPSQTEQLFSPKSVQDAATVSSGGYNFTTFKTKKDTSEGLHTGKSAEQYQDQSSSFVPKVYAWSPKSPDIQDNKVFFEGVFGAAGPDTQTSSTNQNKTNNRKQRSAENKARRWTQKIKEKWRERPGSFGKKGTDDRRVDTISPENSPQCLPLATGNLNLPSNEDSGGTPTSAESTDHKKTVSQTSDGNDEYLRSTNDFELGLGSFSLLDEIVSGQEWAKFINPPISMSIHEGPSPETMDQTLTNYHDGNLGINSMSQDVRKNREAPDTDIAMAQVPPDPSFPDNMDITEKSQIQSEPMDQGQSQSDMLVTVTGQQPCQPTTKTQLINTMESSSLRVRNSLSLSRKRQYQSSERIDTMFHSVITNGSDGADDGSVFLPDNYVMDNTDERTPNMFSSTPTPCSPVRGVLKSTLSYDATNSMETVSKKRRVEETRRVHFSEEIITIDPPELGPYDSESEEEEEGEEDSLIDEDSEEHAAIVFGPSRPEQVAPARRPVLPAWIRALKRRNTGKKPR